MKSQKLNWSYRYRGLEAVEAAIVFPMILFFTVGVLVFGLIFFRIHQLTNAARAGVRVAIIHDKTEADLIGTSGIITQTLTNAGIAVYDTPAIVWGTNPGDPVTVTISTDLGNICPVPIPTLFGMSPLDMKKKITVSATMAKEGP